MNSAASGLATTWGEWALLIVRPSGPGFWLLVDVLAAVGVSLLPVRALEGRASLLRAVRWLLVIFFALAAGALSPQALGMAGIDWETALRLGLPLVAGLLLLLALVRLAVRPEAGQAAGEPGAVPYALLYAGAQQAHWCFQRAALLALFVALPSGNAGPAAAYWATWTAVLLALPGLLHLRSGWARLWSLVALASTAILFFYTRNFWLCWALHAGALLLAGPALVRGDAPVIATARAPRVF